jgi:hypothetical protein
MERRRGTKDIHYYEGNVVPLLNEAPCHEDV